MSLEQALDRLALYRHTRMWLLVVLVIITGASQQARDQRPLENNLTNLLSPDPEIAFTGARNLGLMGGDAWPAFVNLVHVMRSTHNPELAEVCVWAVGRVAEQAGFKLSYQDAQSAAPYVIRGLQEKERRLSFRQASAYTLGRLAAPLQRYTVSGGRDLIESEAVTALTGALADRTLGDDPRHQEFGRTVADALGRFHPASSSAVETVSTLLVDITNRLQDIHMVKPSDRGLSAFQIALTGALSQMGPAAKAAIPRLRVMLQSNDPQAQQAAAYALRNIGPAAAQAAPELIASLENGDANVRQAAAFALGRTRPKGNDGERSVSALAAALGDTDPGVREAAAAALGEFPASESKAALRELTASLEDIDPYVRSASAKSLSAIAEKLNKCPRADAKQVLPRLEATVLALRRAAKSNSVEDPSSDSAIDALTQVEETIRHIHGSRFVVLIRQQPFISSLAIAYVLYLLFLLFVLRFWPTRLLHWNESLDRLAIEGVPLPAHLAALVGPIKVPIRYVLLIGFFRYKSKVLDAWVAEHSSAASSNLARRTTVRARQTYVSLPVQLDDGNSTTLLHLTPQSLHSTCSQNRWCIRVIGEGGSGKTTLACQMARWALAEDPGARLCPDRRAIPILIEPGMIADSEKGAAFRNVIRTQVKAVTGTSEVPSDALLDQLLQTRRVIVILDGASEMEATAVQGPEKLGIDSDFPACALIVTARTIDPFTQSVYTDLLPSRIDTEHLSPFMNAYLRQANLELEDANLFEACRRLSVMVGKRRGITPLLAELYAKALIKVYGQRDSPQNLPSTIPELIVQYLDDLSSSGEGQRFDKLSAV
jgi:HEAT repeat protein